MEERVLPFEVISPLTETGRPISPTRWIVCGLLFAATFLNYLDRQVVSIISPVICPQFHLDSEGYSHLLTAFLCGYTIPQALVGRVVDRFGARKGLLCAMFWWSAAAMFAGFIRTPIQLGICLFLMGVGESANWPASVKATQNHFDAQERGLAVAIFNSGSAGGAVSAPLFITALTLRFSWRFSFLVSGALGLAWIIPWQAFTKREVSSQTSGRLVTSKKGDGWRIVLRRNTLALMGARFFADPVWLFFVFWLPDYLSRTRHFSLRQIGATAWLPFLSAGIGNLAGGWISGQLVKRDPSARTARLRVMTLAAIIMLCGIAVPFLGSAPAVLALISVITFAYCCWAANILTLPTDLFHEHEVASVVGLTGMAGGCGTILIMLLVGVFVKHFSYLPVLIGIGCLPMAALFCGLQTRLGDIA